MITRTEAIRPWLALFSEQLLRSFQRGLFRGNHQSFQRGIDIAKLPSPLADFCSSMYCSLYNRMQLHTYVCFGLCASAGRNDTRSGRYRRAQRTEARRRLKPAVRGPFAPSRLVRVLSSRLRRGPKIIFSIGKIGVFSFHFPIKIDPNMAAKVLGFHLEKFARKERKKQYKSKAKMQK